jgi:general secretion pathway protein F
VLGNRALAADVEAAADEVKNGAGLSLALSRGKRFPRLALQMIQVGEESGALDTMLLKAADTFEQDSARRIDRCWRRWCRRSPWCWPRWSVR